MARMPGLILLVILALPLPGRAEQPPTPDADICISVHLARGHWRRLSNDQLEVETKSGAKMRFPPDGMALKGGHHSIGNEDSIGVCLPRARLHEILRIIQEEIPPHRFVLPGEIFFGPSTKF